jgi:hypothetical protein
MNHLLHSGKCGGGDDPASSFIIVAISIYWLFSGVSDD